jgi:hypothetical protein
LILSCIDNPTKPGKDTPPLALSLVNEDLDTAVFNGEPIPVLIAATDSFAPEDFLWRMGNARFSGMPTIVRRINGLLITTPLTWDRLPARKDSSGRYCDSIYVTTIGGASRSNVVRVFVTNIAPVVRSVTVRGTVIPINEDITTITLARSGACSLSVQVTDIDNPNDIEIDWRLPADSSRIQPSHGVTVTYSVPTGIFRDSVLLHVYDKKGGHVRKTLLFCNVPPNTAPRVDSIRINTALIATMPASTYSYSTQKPDTFRITAYPYDPDKGDSLIVSMRAKRLQKISADSTKSMQAVFICQHPGSYDTLRDTLRVLDTIAVVTKDAKGDSSKILLEVIF